MLIVLLCFYRDVDLTWFVLLWLCRVIMHKGWATSRYRCMRWWLDALLWLFTICVVLLRRSTCVYRRLFCSKFHCYFVICISFFEVMSHIQLERFVDSWPEADRRRDMFTFLIKGFRLTHLHSFAILTVQCSLWTIGTQLCTASTCVASVIFVLKLYFLPANISRYFSSVYRLQWRPGSRVWIVKN